MSNRYLYLPSILNTKTNQIISMKIQQNKYHSLSNYQNIKPNNKSKDDKKMTDFLKIVQKKKQYLQKINNSDLTKSQIEQSQIYNQQQDQEGKSKEIIKHNYMNKYLNQPQYNRNYQQKKNQQQEDSQSETHQTDMPRNQKLLALIKSQKDKYITYENNGHQNNNLKQINDKIQIQKERERLYDLPKLKSYIYTQNSNNQPIRISTNPNLRANQDILIKKRNLLDKSLYQNSLNSNYLHQRYFQDRIKTEVNQFQPKHTNRVSLRIISKIQPKNMPISVTPILKQSSISEKIGKLTAQIPKKLKQRNEHTLKQITTFLQLYNPFFMKLQKIVAICLLKVCSIVKRQKKYVIFEKQEQSTKFYIILSGKVKISNKMLDFKKICYPGQTVGQQIWVTYIEKKCGMMALQKSRVVGQTYLLQIQIQKFKKVKEQLVKFGFKNQSHELQAIIKRNFIVKNGLRQQKNRF